MRGIVAIMGVVLALGASGFVSATHAGSCTGSSGVGEVEGYWVHVFHGCVGAMVGPAEARREQCGTPDVEHGAGGRAVWVAADDASGRVCVAAAVA